MRIILAESQYKRLIKKPLFEENNNDDLNKVLPACKALYNQNTLNQAITWWKDRISNDNFKVKLLYNKFGKIFSKLKWNRESGFGSRFVYGTLPPNEKKEVDKYTKLIAQTLSDIKRRLDNIKLAYDYSPNGGYGGKIHYDEPEIIHVNCAHIKNTTKEYSVSLLVHELQHSIDEFLGTKSGFYYGGFLTDYSQKEMKKIELEYPKQEIDNSNFDIRSAKEVQDDSYFDKEELKRDPDYKNTGYNCSPTEVASRMAQVRHYLNLPINKDVTIYHLTYDFQAYHLFKRNLLCWASRNDNVSLEDYLANLNLLAKNKKIGKDSNRV